jgi:hypothetical protein
MQKPPRYKLIRRLLLPYSGEEPLTRRQTWRIILVWALFFPFILSLASLPIAFLIMGTVVWQKIVLFFLLTFFSGVVIFGAMAWFAVVMMNRVARIYQQRKQISGTSGGRYGS